MTSFQKVVKHLAICLAILICLGIFVGIVECVKTIFESLNIIGENDTNTEYSEVIDYDESFNYLDISLKNSNLVIEPGDKFSIDTSDNNIKIYTKADKLKIVDKSRVLFNIKSKKTIITIPYDYYFEAVKVETGAGKVNINGIYTNLLEMELGAGKTHLNNIASNKTNIETGVGSVDISNSRLNDLDLELGVGKVSIVSEITGVSNIESGVGSLKLDLIGNESMYKFSIEKGIGSITFNDEKISNNTTIGNGESHINIEGGIGSITINTLRNER